MTPRIIGMTSSSNNTALNINKTPALLKNVLHACFNVELLIELHEATDWMFESNIIAI